MKMITPLSLVAFLTFGHRKKKEHRRQPYFYVLLCSMPPNLQHMFAETSAELRGFSPLIWILAMKVSHCREKLPRFCTCFCRAKQGDGEGLGHRVNCHEGTCHVANSKWVWSITFMQPLDCRQAEISLEELPVHRLRNTPSSITKASLFSQIHPPCQLWQLQSCKKPSRWLGESLAKT